MVKFELLNKGANKYYSNKRKKSTIYYIYDTWLQRKHIYDIKKWNLSIPTYWIQNMDL